MHCGYKWSLERRKLRRLVVVMVCVCVCVICVCVCVWCVCGVCVCVVCLCVWCVVCVCVCLGVFVRGVCVYVVCVCVVCVRCMCVCGVFVCVWCVVCVCVCLGVFVCGVCVFVCLCLCCVCVCVCLWCVSVCVSVCVCVCVCPSLCCRFASRSVQEGCSRLCMTASLRRSWYTWSRRLGTQLARHRPWATSRRRMTHPCERRLREVTSSPTSVRYMYRVCNHSDGILRTITPETDTGTVTTWGSAVATVSTVRFIAKQEVQFAYTALVWTIYNFHRQWLFPRMAVNDWSL